MPVRFLSKGDWQTAQSEMESGAKALLEEKNIRAKEKIDLVRNARRDEGTSHFLKSRDLTTRGKSLRRWVKERERGGEGESESGS